MKHITYTDLRVFIVEGTKRVYFAVVLVKARLEVVIPPSIEGRVATPKLYTRVRADNRLKRRKTTQKISGPWPPKHCTPSHYKLSRRSSEDFYCVIALVNKVYRPNLLKVRHTSGDLSRLFQKIKTYVP